MVGQGRPPIMHWYQPHSPALPYASLPSFWIGKIYCIWYTAFPSCTSTMSPLMRAGWAFPLRRSRSQVHGFGRFLAFQAGSWWWLDPNPALQIHWRSFSAHVYLNALSHSNKDLPPHFLFPASRLSPHCWPSLSPHWSSSLSSLRSSHLLFPLGESETSGKLLRDREE